ncbi:glycosyltransferase family 2 protein [Mycolicibacterium sp.]|uniref:glycosyltransferase family 2 protein n=1 Tax=Mycolicibacterium sp. TaxID=2320850 RepID=UPI003D11B5A6
MTSPVSIRDMVPHDNTRPKISVIIPALNEARNLPHVADRIPADIDEIVFVDGGSQDDTVEVAKRLWPEAVHLRQSRKGKGNALNCGFAAATGDVIVMIDADGSTDPAEIPRFVGALMAGADFAKGSRFIQGGGSDDITRIRRAGNWGLNALVNVLFGTRYTDLCYGYNAFWRHCLGAFNLPDIGTTEPQWGDGFEIETLINVRVAAHGLSITEVHSHEAVRIHGASNLNAVRDGLRVLRTIRSEFFALRAAARRTAARRTAAAQAASDTTALADVIPPSTLRRLRLRRRGIDPQDISLDRVPGEQAL